jgi:hypothetical protein
MKITPSTSRSTTSSAMTCANPNASCRPPDASPSPLPATKLATPTISGRSLWPLTPPKRPSPRRSGITHSSRVAANAPQPCDFQMANRKCSMLNQTRLIGRVPARRGPPRAPLRLVGRVAPRAPLRLGARGFRRSAGRWEKVFPRFFPRSLHSFHAIFAPRGHPSSLSDKRESPFQHPRWSKSLSADGHSTTRGAINLLSPP